MKRPYPPKIKPEVRKRIREAFAIFQEVFNKRMLPVCAASTIAYSIRLSREQNLVFFSYADDLVRWSAALSLVGIESLRYPDDCYRHLYASLAEDVYRRRMSKIKDALNHIAAERRPGISAEKGWVRI